MVKEKKIGCMIFSIGDEFRKLSHCAVKSFKKFHPEIEMNYVDESNIDSFEVNKHVPEEIRNHYGTFRFAIAAEIMGKKKYDKFIFLGADTITCARLDEFLEHDDYDMLLTSNYPYQVAYPYSIEGLSPMAADPPLYQTIYTPILYAAHKDGEVFTNKDGSPLLRNYPRSNNEFLDHANKVKEKHDIILKAVDYFHANTDVLCFNSLEALKDVYKYSIKYWKDYHAEVPADQKKTMPEQLEENGYVWYGDQGGLNILTSLSMMSDEGGLSGIESPLHPLIKPPNHRIMFIDLPFIFTPSLYNVRSKRSIAEWKEVVRTGVVKGHSKAHPSNAENDGESISDFYVKDEKLYSIDNKQIKVWHYLTGLGLLTEIQDLGKVNQTRRTDKHEPTEEELAEARRVFCEKVNAYTSDMFNQETRDFFTDYCDCGDFFKQKFEV